MRKLAAIMFTDIVGYTALMGQDEPKALQLLQHNRELLKPIIKQFHGEWLKEIGDGTLSSFASAVDAVTCALGIQHILRDDPDLALRIGIHVGDVVFEKGDVFGDGVNVASRLEPLADPGCICVSGRVYDDIRNKPGIEAEFLGEQELKGVDHPMKVYAVTERRAVFPKPEREIPGASRSQWRLPALAAAAVTLTIAILLLFRGWLEKGMEPGAEMEVGKKSIAILYFDNMSTDTESDVWCAGMTEAIITALAKLGKFDVKSRTEVLQYKDHPVDFKELRENLGVDAFLEGSLQKMGNTIRVHAQLIDTQSGYHLWAEKYDRPADDIFAVQDDISQKIVTALGIELEGIQPEVLEAQPTENLQAFEWASHGIYYYDRQMYDMALAAFDSALAADPGYSRAYYYKGRAYQDKQEYDKAMDSYKKALMRAEKFSRTLQEWRSPEEAAFIYWAYHEEKLIAVGLMGDVELEQSYLFGLDLSHNALIWKKIFPDLPSYTLNLPIVIGDLVVCTSNRSGRTQPGEAAVFAYDIESGKQVFWKEFPRKHLDEHVHLNLISVHEERSDQSQDAVDKPLMLLKDSHEEVEIHRLNPSNGATLWKITYGTHDMSPYIAAVPGLQGENLLLIHYLKRKASLVDAADGTVVWDMDLDQRQKLFVSHGNIVSVLEDSTIIIALSVSDKARVWDYKTQAPIGRYYHFPKSSLVVLQLEGGHLLALNTGKKFLGLGRKRWETNLGTDRYRLFYRQAHPPEKVDAVYAVSEDGTLYVMDVETGEIRGKTATEMEEIRLKVFEQAVIGVSANYVFSMDPASGKILWRVRNTFLDKRIYDVFAGKVIAKAGANLVSAYDLEYGDLLWNYKVTSEYHVVWRPEGKDQLFVGMKDRLVEVNHKQNPEEKLIEEKNVLVNLAQCATELRLYGEAEGYLTEVVETKDPGYAQGYWSLADLYTKTGKRNKSIQALVNYHALFLIESPEAARARQRLKTEAGLLWLLERHYHGYVVDDERVYIGDIRWQSPVELSAFNKTTGEVLWTVDFYQDVIISKWTHDDNDIYVTGLDKPGRSNWVTSSVQKATGETNWRRIIRAYGDGGRLTPLGLDKHRLYVTYIEGRDHSLFALSASTGELVWEKKWISSTSAFRWMFLGSAIAVAIRDSIQFLDPASGDILWSYLLEKAAEVGYLTREGLQGNRFIFTTRDNHYVCLDLVKRKRLWKFKSPLITSGYFATVDYASGDTLYDWGESIFAFIHDSMAPEGGRLLWNTPLDGQASSLSYDANWIYAVLPDNTLLRLDRATGAVDRKFQLLWGRLSPVVHNKLGVFSSHHHVYALRLGE